MTILVEPEPAVEDLPGDHDRDHRRGRLARAARTTRSSRRTRPATTSCGITPDWRTLGQYYAGWRSRASASTWPPTSGRRRCAGWCWATTTRIRRRRSSTGCGNWCGKAMREGAVGLSTSLQYPPAPYAETAELIALASEAAKLGGVYATHMRNESDEILRRARRGDPDRPRGGDPGRDLAPQDGRQAQLGADARGRREDRFRPAGGRRHRGRHLRLPGVVQLALRPSSRPGRTTAAPPSCWSGCAIPRRAARIKQEMESADTELGQQLAEDPGPGGDR